MEQHSEQSSNLIQWGFEANPNDDPCVVNKRIYEKQCTVLWHFNDLKISLADPKVLVTEIVDIATCRPTRIHQPIRHFHQHGQKPQNF